MITANAGRIGSRPVLGWIALACVYVFWGSTYLAIRVGVRTMPPFFLAAARYLIPGVILCAFTYAGPNRRALFSREYWLSAGIVGFLMLLGGNGLLTVGERTVPSGIAALFIATVPLWMALLDAVRYRRGIGFRLAAGLALGFVGTGILVSPSASHRLDPGGAILVLVCAVMWAAGSLYSRDARLPVEPLGAIGMEMLAGGVWLALAGMAAGEVHPIVLTWEAIVAVAWLAVAGSLVGFTCYIYTLKVLPTSTAATYAFVNPVVAVFLGWRLLGEPITGQTVLAMAVIVLGVILILNARR